MKMRLQKSGNLIFSPQLLRLILNKVADTRPVCTLLIMRNEKSLQNLQAFLFFCTTYGNRTRDSSVKGRRLNPLTNAALIALGWQR